MESQPQNVGLGGDGDEIAAIREVEEEFDVTLDYSDAHNWATVADVYAALLDQLSVEEAVQPGVWNRFSEAICRETGISPSSISLESGLIAEDGMWVHVVKVSPFVWIMLALAGMVGMVWLLR
jgi:hypothetical protein